MAQDRIEVLIQEINSKFDLILTSQVALLKKIDDLEIDLSARLRHNSSLIDAISKKIDAIAEVI